MPTYRIQDLPLASTPLDGLADAVEVIQGGINRQTPVDTLWRPLGTASDEACAGDDARLSDARAPVGAAGGELAGTYPNPTVAAVAGTTPTVTGLAVLGAISQAAAQAAIGVSYGPAVNGRLAIRDTNGVTNTADYATATNGGVAVLAVNGYARLAQAAFPGTPVEGEIINDASRRCLAARIGGMTQFDRRAIALQVADVTVSTIGAQPILVPNGGGALTLPANFLSAGKVLEIDILGAITSIGDTGALTVTLGGSTVLTGALVIPVRTAAGVRVRVRVVCATAGPTGTVRGTAEVVLDDAVSLGPAGRATINPNASAVVIDTTAAQALAVTWNWTSAAQTFRSCTATVEASA